MKEGVGEGCMCNVRNMIDLLHSDCAPVPLYTTSSRGDPLLKSASRSFLIISALPSTL